MGRKIRVVHFADKFGKAGASVHGVTRLLSWWFTRWDTQNFDVRLVGLRAGDHGLDRMRETVPGVIALERHKFDPRTGTDMVRLIREYNADIVHLHGYAACNFGRIAARLTGAKIVIHEHFVDPHMPAYQSLTDRALAPLCDHSFAVSKSVREFMIHRRHLHEAQVEVLYNGAPMAEFQPPAPAVVAAARTAWGIPPGHLVLGTVGRLDAQKGVSYLIDALPALVQRGHRLRLMVVGDGPLMGVLKAQAERLDLTDVVLFTGYQADIPLLQSLFDVQVFPSLYEGTPLTLFEAMSMGRAIVSTNVDGLGEILADGRNARVVQPQDSQALAGALDSVLQDPGQRQRLAAQARRESVDYDIGKLVERMQTVYTSLVKHR